MPVERVSKGFLDISLSFSKNALTNDLIILRNETAIARSIRNLVLTRLGEVFFNPELGVPDMLFENIDGITLDLIKDRIKNIISRYEPRVNLQDVDAELREYDNELNIALRYEIIGINIPAQQLAFALVNNR
jgi:phage baseplate assembly protein W